jgi:hypothetical protein
MRDLVVALGIVFPSSSVLPINNMAFFAIKMDRRRKAMLFMGQDTGLLSVKESSFVAPKIRFCRFQNVVLRAY